MLTPKITQTDPLIKVVDLVQAEIIHPTLNVVCKKNKIIRRKPIKHASVEGPKMTQYINAQYTFIHPDTGKRSYYTPPLPGVIGKKRHDTATILKVMEPVIRNEMTNTAAARQGRHTFHLTTVPGTVHKWLDQIDVDTKSFDELQQTVVRQCSGHLSIDEVYDDEGTIITTDPVQNTILHISTHPESITNETVEKHLDELKQMGIQPKTVTKDGSPLYIQTILNIFGSLVLLQTCLFHLIKSCMKDFCTWMKQIRNEIKVPKMKRGRKKKGDQAPAEGNPFKKLKQRLFRLRFAILRLQVTPEERKELRGLFTQFPMLKMVRGCFLLLKRLLQSPNLEEAEQRYQQFINNKVLQTHIPGVIKKLETAYKRNELFSYLWFDKSIHKKIRTTNHTERTNRKFRKKQKTHYRIRKYENKVKMLRLMQYFHNFEVVYGKKEGVDMLIIQVLYFFVRQKIRRVFTHTKQSSR